MVQSVILLGDARLGSIDMLNLLSVEDVSIGQLLKIALKRSNFFKLEPMMLSVMLP